MVDWFPPHGLRDPLPVWLCKGRGDGILARIEDRSTARQSGFRSRKHLGDVFVRETGAPPGQHRRQACNALELPAFP